MEAWEQVADIKLKEPICNIGCFSVSRNEILLFGGLDSQAKEVKTGIILMCLGGSHNYLEERVDLLIPDQFSNTTQVHTFENGKTVLLQGKQAIHKLDLSNSLKRTFSIAFQQEQ